MAVSTGVAAVGAIGSLAKFFEGSQMQRDAQRAIQEFKYQDLQNPYEHQQVSTLGSDLMREQANLSASQDVNALQAGGNRALVGGLGRVEAQRNLVNRNVAANLDEQQKAINMAKAAQDVQNQQTIENRQNAQLQGYGQLMNVGLGMKYGALGDFTNVAGAAGTALAGMNEGEGFGGFTPQVSELNQLTPQGTYAKLPNYANVPQDNTPEWAKQYLQSIGK